MEMNMSKKFKREPTLPGLQWAAAAKARKLAIK
jgi:hypothetical protein